MVVCVYFWKFSELVGLDRSQSIQRHHRYDLVLLLDIEIDTVLKFLRGVDVLIIEVAIFELIEKRLDERVTVNDIELSNDARDKPGFDQFVDVFVKVLGALPQEVFWWKLLRKSR